MEEREVHELFERRITSLDPEAEYEVHHEDYTVEFPQSGERMNRDNLRSMQEANPASPTFRPRRLVGAGDVWTAEFVGDYSGRIYYGVAIIEFRDGKIWKETRYYADPFEPPARRAQWVERMEEPDWPRMAASA